MASDPSVIESLDALHIENENLQTELGAAVRELAKLRIELDVERELVAYVAPLDGVTPGQVAKYRQEIACKLAAERRLACDVEAFLRMVGGAL